MLLMVKNRLDINCDLGEGFPYDAQLMPLITSANIACGFHAGDRDTIKRTIEAAMKNKVAIGAHPSYPDREHFGRRSMVLSDVELATVLEEQLYLFNGVAQNMGATLHHIKLHGALYNDAAADAALAEKVIRILKNIAPGVLVYGLSGSVFTVAAQKNGVRVAHEVFADRGYQSDGSLTPRSEPGALIEDEEQALQQVLRMMLTGQVQALNGDTIAIRADTLCIHGDGRQALQLARYLNDALQRHFITLQTFSSPL
jgi:5-oxoprolinase (ATP-hydrolysing) subunit A